MRTLISTVLIALIVVCICIVPGQAFSDQLTPPTGSDLTKPVGAIFYDLNGSAEAERQEQVENQEIPSYSDSSITTQNSSNSVLKSITGPPPWLNVPMSRFSFDTAEDQGVGWFSRVTAKNLGGGIASMADGVFLVASMPVNWGIEIIYLAFRTNWIAALADQVTAPSKTLWVSFMGNGLGGNSLFSVLIVAILGYLLVFFARMQLMRAIRSIVITILILTFGFVYFSNAGQFLLEVSNVTDGLSGFVLSSVGGAFSSNQPGQPEQSGLDYMLQSFGRSMWCSLVANSWADMEFGTSVPQNLLLTQQEFEKIKDDSTIAQNSYAPGTNPPQKTDPVTSGWIKANESRIDQIVLAYSSNNVARGEIINVLADPDVDHGKHQIAKEKLLPYNKMKCVVFSFFFLVVGLVFLVFCVCIGGAMILAQITLLGIMLAIPIIVFISMIPETGWAFGYKYAKMLIAALGTKIMYGVFLSVIVMISNFIFWFI